MRPEVDPTPVDRLIAERASAQHGVISRSQLRALGLGDSGVKTRARNGRIHRIHRGVYAVGHARLTWEGRVLAAVLACGPGAVASHRCAADLLEIRRSASPRIDVTVPSRNGRRPPRGVSIYRVRALPGNETTVRCGIPVTSLARTLLDLASVVDRRSLERAVEQAETLEIFDLTAIQAVLTAHPNRSGSRALKVVLGLWSTPERTRSDLEDLFLALCETHGIERPLVNAPLGPYEIDFLWQRQRVIVETDSHRHHGTRAAFERDRARDARLTAAGYRVLRFTYRQVIDRPDFVAEVLRSML